MIWCIVQDEFNEYQTCEKLDVQIIIMCPLVICTGWAIFTTINIHDFLVGEHIYNGFHPFTTLISYNMNTQI